jgi:hypothetical protein
VIIRGDLNRGGQNAEIILADNGESPSSTIAIGALCRVSGLAVAEMQIEKLNV